MEIICTFVCACLLVFNKCRIRPKADILEYETSRFTVLWCIISMFSTECVEFRPTHAHTYTYVHAYEDLSFKICQKQVKKSHI